MTTNPKKTFTLRVMPEDFEGAERGNEAACGVHFAGRRIGLNLRVDPGFSERIRIHSSNGSSSYVDGPAGAIRRWDEGGPIPDPFTLELPISLLETVE